MTLFLLVSGPFTGGWVWDEVAARLRAEGAAAHPVTLTGQAPRAPGAGPAGTDAGLETHVDDLVRLIDGLGDGGPGEVVLVGHDYGIHPVLGAAGRRPERIARVVYVAAGLAEDGDPALRFVRDEAARDRLTAATGPRPADVPAPVGEEWERWGSTEGLSPAVRERLDRLAVPQPARTLTEPLRLSAAVADIPATGVLCTADGPGIGMIEMLAEAGPPQFRALAERGVTFFELDTGHWPMLSRPDDLAGVLLAAAAGRGHRLPPPAPGRTPAPDEAGAAADRPFLLDVSVRPRERTGRIDLHLPEADGPRPAVLFVHGGPVAADARPTPRDSPVFLGYARHAADLGAVGITLDHRLHGLTDYGRAAGDLAEAVERARAHPLVDERRIALWFFSGGGLLAADWLAAPPPWLRALAFTYPVLAPPPGWETVPSRFRPVTALASAGRLPLVLTRAGREHPDFARTVTDFLDAARAHGAAVEVVDVPHGRHGFETLDPTEESRAAVRHAMRSVLARLTEAPGGDA
ncbi:alpha/beta fold hydrolase [Streptomyces sp. NPDC126503]|uniref:alpha/beta hydrolase n=1 Tax=Streptomyces sp. NPDC126503 TaxID=3155315 RepID=UPI0033235E54